MAIRLVVTLVYIVLISMVVWQLSSINATLKQLVELRAPQKRPIDRKTDHVVEI